MFNAKNPGKIIIIVVLFVLLIAATNFLIQASISCMDKYGCLKSFCDYSLFDNEFKAIIDANRQRCEELRG